MVWCRPDYAVADAEAWIQGTIAGRVAQTSYEFAIVDPVGMLAGVCGLTRVNNVDRLANLGYWVRTSKAGQGIAPRAVLALAEWAFAHTALNRLEIVVAEGNARSHQVARKVGAEREALLRERMMVGGQPTDAVMYALTRGRWPSSGG